MPLLQPYLFTSPRVMTLVDRPQMVPAEGPLEDPIYGFHTLWAAEVPFIPAHVGKDDRDFDSEATNRISRAMQRQIRFLYDLAQCRDNLTTFELRLVARPQPGKLTSIGIAYLGKTFHPNEQMSRKLALRLWEKFSAVFPREVPFSYPLLPVCQPSTADRMQTHTFQEWYEPIPFAQLTESASVVELRKHEDWPTLRNIGGVYHAHDYVPHPFVPALDYSAMARLFETMAQQESTCVVAITIRPQVLTDQEELILHEHASWFERVANGDIQNDNPLAETMHELKNDVFDAYPRAHAEHGLQVYNTLKKEARSLMTVRLQVIGTPIAQESLIEALGSEVMANAGNAYPSRWTRVEASDASELRWALFNLQWLEFVRWGISPFIQQSPAIVRLRQLATVTEVVGAFRLPVAPGGGWLAGLNVRDEPFSPPPTVRDMQGDTLLLGTIVDRGIATGVPCLLPLSSFSGLTQLFGQAGPARERVLLQLLSAANSAAIPWMLVGTRDAAYARLAAQLQVRHIQMSASLQKWSLDFYPFTPPPAVPLHLFIDALVRVFMTAHVLDFAAGSLLRRALLSTYEAAGWTNGNEGMPIELATLAEQIEAVAQQGDVSMQTATILRTRCVLALRDLLATAPMLSAVATTRPRFELKPTIFEIGWIGSDNNRDLLQGCLWSWLSLAFTATPHGFIAIADAHTLFGPYTRKSNSSSNETASRVAPMVTLAQNMQQTGIGTMFIDGRPDLFSTEITSNANCTILTANTTIAASEEAATLIGASPRQRQRLAHLEPDEAVLTLRGKLPVFVRL